MSDDFTKKSTFVVKLKIVAGRYARPGLRNLSFEMGLSSLQFIEFFSSSSLKKIKKIYD